LRLFATQPANNSSPKKQKQPKISLSENAFASLLLLLHSFPKIQIESASILPIALGISLFADILFFGKYAFKLATGTIFEMKKIS
jgi:galactose-1-phosphate uridylyltransferase